MESLEQCNRLILDLLAGRSINQSNWIYYIHSIRHAFSTVSTVLITIGKRAIINEVYFPFMDNMRGVWYGMGGDLIWVNAAGVPTSWEDQ